MKKYGLIGKSLGHSFSKAFFTEYFTKHNIVATYENIEVATESDLRKVIKDEFAGLNVTIPYKEAIIPFLDDLTEEAKEIGAVNVVEHKDGVFIGHNTDAFGFHQSIKPFLTNKHERAIIFGTGGAAKAVEYTLKSIGVDVIYVSRTPKNGQFSYEEVNDHMLNACKLLVNCTPVGMYPDVEKTLSIPFEFLTQEHLVVDLIYNPSKTLLLQEAEKNGAAILNGESMLREQALKAWEIWNK